MKPDELAALRAKADEHQRRLDADTVYWTVQILMKRWGVSATTVAAIPPSLLPYINIGTGLKRERRRYNPDDVYEYETKQKMRHKRAG